MKKNNKNTILTVITASLLLLATGCSQSAETVNVTPNITTDSTAVTTINTDAETPKETTTAVTAAQTTAQITTAAATTVITTAPVTEAQPVTKQTEVQEAPVITTTTTTKAAPVVTTTTTTPAPKQEEKPDEDRSYLNLSPSEVRGILDECQRYAVSLGYRVLTYSQYKIEEEEYDRKQKEILDRDGSREELDELRNAWKTDLKYITDISDEDFWNGGWHNIMYAGDFKKRYENVYMFNGYDSCSTKEESIKLIISYLKTEIKEEHKNGQSVSVAATKLKIFDEIIRDGDWGIMNGEDVRMQYATGNFIFDINTSYAFSVSR